MAVGSYTPWASACAAGLITAKTLTASIISDPTKPYDGNANATLTSANFSLSGLVGSQTITVTQTSGTYTPADVGATTVTASLTTANFTAGAGTLLGNYTLPSSASGAGHITAKTLTASIISDPTKPYDGNANPTLTSANFSPSRLVGCETITGTQTSGTYTPADVGATTVTASLTTANFTAGAGTLLGDSNRTRTGGGR